MAPLKPVCNTVQNMNTSMNNTSDLKECVLKVLQHKIPPTGYLKIKTDMFLELHSRTHPSKHKCSHDSLHFIFSSSKQLVKVQFYKLPEILNQQSWHCDSDGKGSRRYTAHLLSHSIEKKKTKSKQTRGLGSSKRKQDIPEACSPLDWLSKVWEGDLL